MKFIKLKQLCVKIPKREVMGERKPLEVQEGTCLIDADMIIGVMYNIQSFESDSQDEKDFDIYCDTNHIKFLPFFGENSIDEDLATDFTYFHTKSKITLITRISGANITFVFCLPANNGAGMKNCSFLPIYGVAELGENEYIYINGTKYQENIVSIPLSSANTFNVSYIKNGVGRTSEIQKIQGFWEL